MVPEAAMPLPEGETRTPSDLNYVEIMQAHPVSSSVREDHLPGDAGYSTSLEHEHIQQTPSASSPSQQLKRSEAEDRRGHNQNQHISVVYKLPSLADGSPYCYHCCL